MEDTPPNQTGCSKWVWLRRTAAGVCVLLVLMAVGVDGFGQQDLARPVDAIVVLGARVEPGGVPGDSLRHRTLRAVQLFRQGVAPAILFTGGVGKNPPSEARVARELARSLDVPEAACVLEEQSTSTWENAICAADICRKRGWRRVVVVSDPYHLLRASRNFRKVGLEVYPSPAKECARNRHFGLRAEWAVLDTLLLLRDFLLGRV